MNTSSLPTVCDWLDLSTDRLRRAKIESARLDSLIMLEDCLNISRTKILTDSKSLNINSKNLLKLNKYLNRRLNHEPIAYIRGFCEFYGRQFFVDYNVLIPRPESEAFIEIIKSNLAKDGDLIADIGTGSGCLGITTKLELPFTEVDLIELSNPAIKVAKRNIESLGSKVKLIRDNLLQSNTKSYQIMLANLPYVPDKFKLDSSTSFEPKIAVFGGRDGLDLYRQLFNLVMLKAERPNYILVEALKNQHTELVELAKGAGYRRFKTLGLVICFKLNA